MKSSLIHRVCTKYSWFTLLYFLAVTSLLQAQQPRITPETPVTTGILHQWLNSGESLQIAWAADFARKTHNAKIIAEMPALLEHWTIPQAYDGDKNESHIAPRRAVVAVLDTLIQENVQVPISTIQVVAESFPAEAVILMSRLPLDESRQTLYDWTYGENGSWSERLRARIAAMMLANDPVLVRNPDEPYREFVARIISASEENLRVSVISSVPEAGTASGSCGDALPTKPSAGWPRVYVYFLLENDRNEKSLPLLDLDGDRIFTYRQEWNQGWGSCGEDAVAPLNPATRHRLIAHWLGVSAKNMPWQPVEERSIIWTNQSVYEQQLGQFVDSEREKLRASVKALCQRGLLTEDGAATAMPKLVVTIQCDIQPCPLN